MPCLVHIVFSRNILRDCLYTTRTNLDDFSLQLLTLLSPENTDAQTHLRFLCIHVLYFVSDRQNFIKHIMSQRLFSTIGKLGIGLAVTGGVVQTALYNGIFVQN